MSEPDRVSTERPRHELDVELVDENDIDTSALDAKSDDLLCFVLTDPPGPDSQFVDCTDAAGRGIGIGEWVQREGFWELRVPLDGTAALAEAQARIDQLAVENAALKAEAPRTRWLRADALEVGKIYLSFKAKHFARPSTHIVELDPTSKDHRVRVVGSANWSWLTSAAPDCWYLEITRPKEEPCHISDHSEASG